MSQRQFAGDSSFRLPKGTIEPYRLWFEYLKVADRHPNIEVDRSLYGNWGAIEGVAFDDWWSKHWRELFATQAETAVIEQLMTSAPQGPIPGLSSCVFLFPAPRNSA